MDGDEVEMTKEELQNFIKQSVKNNMLEKCYLLQSLLRKREKQGARFLKLCQSVAAYEKIVKNQYSVLGWEWRDSDSDDDDDDGEMSGNSPPPLLGSVPSETQAPSSSTAYLLAEPDNSEQDNGKKNLISLKRKPVVVLRRLPPQAIDRCERAPTPASQFSDDDSDMDPQWEPQEDSSDSNYSLWSNNSGSNKRRKMDLTNGKLAKSLTTNKDANINTTKTLTAGVNENTDTNSNTNKTLTTEVNVNSDAKSNAAKTATTTVGINTNVKRNIPTTSTPNVNGKPGDKSNAAKPSTPPVKNNGVSSVCTITALSQSSDKDARTPPNLPQEEISVNMNVLARRKAMSWKQGKVMEIITTEDGRVKYKIHFEENGKGRVSGHHIAYTCMAKVEYLYIGARVVVKSKEDESQFHPGILAELPGRKNRMRFLFFSDNHTPSYISLPDLHLVCRPLADPLDDIQNITHKYFMREYLKVWPFVPQTQYRQKQKINVEVNGFQERCEVQDIDSSLIQVLTERDENLEWIYRGSIRLEHMSNLKAQLKREGERAAESEESSTS